MALLFDEAFLRKLEYLYILSRKVFAGRARALRPSKKLGTGLEFADHRDYARGDDPRYLDWNVVGRMDRLLVRLFEEEEDLYIYLLVDASASMTLGDPSPFDYARQVTAALAYIGLANLDRVSIIPFAATAEEPLPPTRGKGQIYKVFRFLEAVPTGGGTSFEGALEAFIAQTRHTGLAVIVSDFFAKSGDSMLREPSPLLPLPLGEGWGEGSDDRPMLSPDFEAAFDRLRWAGFEAFAVQVHLPAGRPAAAALRGERRLVDVETGRARTAVITPATLRRYDAAFTRLQERLARYCLAHGVGFVRAPVDVPFERAILSVFRQGGFLK